MKLTNRAKSALATAGYSLNNDSAITQLTAFAAQNSGIERGNYYNCRDANRQSVRDGRRAFAQECRSITADWKRFKDALIQAALDGVTSDDLIREAPHAFSGRLEWQSRGEWSYCVGQYFPTEYRKAAATLLEYAARQRRANRPPEQRIATSICELEILNAKNGGCWFEPGSMRFFGTRICGDIQFNRYFITSEQPPHGDRCYTIRSFDDKGSVDTIGEFCGYSTQARAQAALRELVATSKEAA